MSGVVEKTLKGTALFLVKSGALDSMFDSMASGLGLAVDKVALFTRDLQTVYAWRKAEGDLRAALDFPSFVDRYLTDLLSDAIASRPLPAARALRGLVVALADLASVKRTGWAGAIKDHESFLKSRGGSGMMDLGGVLVEAARAHGEVVRAAVQRDFDAARAWADLSGADK